MDKLSCQTAKSLQLKKKQTGVAILAQKVLLLYENKHLLVTLFKHVLVFMSIRINMLKCLCDINTTTLKMMLDHLMFDKIFVTLTSRFAN